MFVATDVVINMVDVAQLAEHLVVVQGVAGSSPVFHPKVWAWCFNTGPRVISVPVGRLPVRPR